MPYTCVPAKFVVGFGCPVAQIGLVDKSSIRHIPEGDRLANYNLLEGYPPGCYLFDCCSVEDISSGVDEELVVGVVFGVDLVVELDHIEIYQVAYFLVDCDVASVLVVFIFEVGGLGGVTEDVVGYLGPDCLCEFDDPVLSLACVHGFVVLPVDVSSI